MTEKWENCLKKAFADVFKDGAATRDDFKYKMNRAIKECSSQRSFRDKYILEEMLQANEVKGVQERDTKQFFLPPYGPDDFQIEETGRRYYIELDGSKIIPCLSFEQMQRLMDTYKYLKGDINE